MLQTMENPYPIGSKKYLIAQKLMEGKDYDTIASELKVKTGTMYNTKSELKRLLTQVKSHQGEVDTLPRGDNPANLLPPGILPGVSSNQLNLTELPKSTQSQPPSETHQLDQSACMHACN